MKTPFSIPEIIFLREKYEIVLAIVRARTKQRYVVMHTYTHTHDVLANKKKVNDEEHTHGWGTERRARAHLIIYTQ